MRRAAKPTAKCKWSLLVDAENLHRNGTGNIYSQPPFIAQISRRRRSKEISHALVILFILFFRINFEKIVAPRLGRGKIDKLIFTVAAENVQIAR